MNERFHIPIAKHLEDQDNLLCGRDAELVPGQEHLAEDMADDIYEHAILHGFEVLIFCVSPKKRAIETAELVRKSLADKPTQLKVVVEIDENLREIDQGRFILPSEYEQGDEFAGLKIAGKIFSSETFDSGDPSKDNLDYRYGDPLLQKDGTYKYPELKDYFSEPGESYKDVLLRFYSQVIKLSENMERFGDSMEPVIFTHGQPHQIFMNLAEVADKIETEGFSFETGELPHICWDLYKAKKQGAIPFGQIAFVSIEHVCKSHMIEIIKKEIEYLENH